jgi:hypothetical protein
VPNREFPPSPDVLALADDVLDSLTQLTPRCGSICGGRSRLISRLTIRVSPHEPGAVPCSASA